MSWEAYSYSKYFARIHHFPKFSQKRPWTAFINETVNSAAAGALLVMSLFSFLISFGKLPMRLVLSLCASYTALSGYFLFGTARFFGFDISMLNAHKAADLCVWVGLILIVYTLKLLGDVPGLVFRIFLALVVPAMVIIGLGQSGDQVQFGTSLPFGMTLFALLYAFFGQIKLLRSTQSRRYTLGVVGLAFWNVSVINDILVLTGLYDGFAILSIGTVGGLFFFGMALHERILVAYKERDFLRANLEKEVEVKTKNLRLKTQELEAAMRKLKETQSELIQSARLASIGTLAAGIAHEINNSLNYVNGALRPLEKMIFGGKEPSREKLRDLIDMMKDGLQLTFNIIQNLKLQAGMNRSEKTSQVKEVISGVLPMIRSKLTSRHQLSTDLDGNFEVAIPAVALHQVIFNLIHNAVDASPDGGEIKISAHSSQDKAEICVADNGKGMSQDVVGRIFEPFFTTKDVGQGTGLGLHIVKNEIEKQGGSISVASELNQGTTFTISLPLAIENTSQGKAA